jgi:hypothetical protein
MGMKVGGKVAPVSDNPLLQAFYSARKLTRDRKGDRWRLVEATVSTRRLVIGDGDLAATLPKGLSPWERSIGGKPRSKAQKRAAKAAKVSKPKEG